MALIKCPECWKEISDKRKTTSVRKNTLIAIILFIILLVVSSCSSASTEIVEIPYGLKKGMNVDEVKKIMENQGYKYIHYYLDNNTWEPYGLEFDCYNGKQVFGIEPVYVSVELFDANSIRVYYYYSSSDRKNIHNVLDNLIKKYGDPHYHYFRNNVEYWGWGNNDTVLEFVKYDTDDIGDELYYYSGTEVQDLIERNIAEHPYK